MIGIAKQTVVDALESRNVVQNKAFIKGALKSVLNELLVFILDDSSGIRESFEDAIVQVATAPKLLAIIASAVTKDTVAITPIA